MTLPKDLYTKFAIGIIAGYLVGTLGLPIHFAIAQILNLFYTADPATPGPPPPPPELFFLVSQLTMLAIVAISTVVAVLSPTPLAAFRRISFVLVPCIIFTLFIHVSVLIFGD